MNHANGNDIDYNFSINAGGNVGEIGGTFVKTLTTSAGYIADPTLGAAISLSTTSCFAVSFTSMTKTQRQFLYRVHPSDQ
ncbi:MAG: hypothetical protein WDM76_18265 [Limisphaerales bacterium]